MYNWVVGYVEICVNFYEYKTDEIKLVKYTYLFYTKLTKYQTGFS